MGLTTDPTDPRLTHYTGPEAPGPQAEVYLVLSDEEIAKGYTRPYRDTYRHVGPAGPQHPTRPLTDEEKQIYFAACYVAFETYPPGAGSTGRFWTQAQLDHIGKGCGTETRMGEKLAATYARSHRFYGATYCVHCQAHFPVAEFVWSADGQIVGS